MFMFFLLKEHVAKGPMHSFYSRKDTRIQRMEKRRERELEAERVEAIRIMCQQGYIIIRD